MVFTKTYMDAPYFSTVDERIARDIHLLSNKKGKNMKCFSLFLVMLCFSANSFSEVLVKIDALNGKVHLLAPKDFGPMPANIIEMKYPSSRRPSEVLSDKTGAITLAFNHTNNPMEPSQIKEAHVAMSQMFHRLYPSAKWIRDEVIKQNGSTFMVMELITPALDTQIHNIIYGTSIDGHFLLAAFNVTVEKSDKWLPIGKKIMNSLTVN